MGCNIEHVSEGALPQFAGLDQGNSHFLAEVRDNNIGDFCPKALAAADVEDIGESKPLANPSGKIEIFSQTVADCGYEDCPGHLLWLQPNEWRGKTNSRRSPHLESNQLRDKLRPQLGHGNRSKANKVASRTPIHILLYNAAACGLQAGDVVRLFNVRGACLAGVVLDATRRRGVVQMRFGAWYEPDHPAELGSLCKHDNPNVMTRDKDAPKLGQGPSAHSCLNELEQYEKAQLPVTAHQPPVVIQPETSTIREDTT